MNKRIWDISPPVREGTPVFPGDTPYRQRWAAELGPGCPVNVSELTLSPHAGAHADAPLHYDPQGASAGQLELDAYLGACRVIHAIGVRPLIEWSHLEHATKDLPSHQVIRRRDLRVLENLVLDDVPEGDYELIALPLKLMSADASPVRAILRQLAPTP
jgi:arylformamidase